MNHIVKTILHLFYWVVFCLLSGLISFRLAQGLGFVTAHLPHFLYNTAWAAIQFYLFYFMVYRFIGQQRYLAYFIVSVVVSAGLSLFMYLLFGICFGFPPPQDEMHSVVPPMVGTFIIGHTGSLLRGFITWSDNLRHKQEMEKMLIRNELDLLKAQLNPHFLFNTLNNIDALIFRQPQKASESLITLSGIMRYMLVEAREPQVPLARELEHYEKVIRLQSLRMASPEAIRFSRPSAVGNLKTAPLLFLPFVENAFKHASQSGTMPVIDFRLDVTDTAIQWSARNHFNPRQNQSTAQQDGIGLSNLKRRLELLYPGRYSLETRLHGNEFFAELKLTQCHLPA
ncbi:MAG: histidine kinase [Breznakibacter sp.]